MKAGGLGIFQIQCLIFRCNIRFGDIIFFQKLLQIAAVSDQHNLTEFPCLDILEPGNLLPGTEAKPRLPAKVIWVLATLIFTSGIRDKIASSSRS